MEAVDVVAVVVVAVVVVVVHSIEDLTGEDDGDMDRPSNGVSYSDEAGAGDDDGVSCDDISGLVRKLELFFVGVGSPGIQS